jgi:hypothetical protein
MVRKKGKEKESAALVAVIANVAADANRDIPMAADRCRCGSGRQHGSGPGAWTSWDRTFQCTAALLIGDIRCPVQTGDGLWGDRLASFGRSVPVLLISGDGADIGQGPRYQL